MNSILRNIVLAMAVAAVTLSILVGMLPYIIALTMLVAAILHV